ncbi:MAG: hypothetical protein WBH63_07050, partial [Bacillota bacterium]
ALYFTGSESKGIHVCNSLFFLILSRFSYNVNDAHRDGGASATFLEDTGSISAIFSDLFGHMLITTLFSTSFPQRDGSISTTLYDSFEQTLING